MTRIKLTPSFQISVAAEQAMHMYTKPDSVRTFGLTTKDDNRDVGFILRWVDYINNYPEDFGYIFH